jgi:hypothetical protein
MRAFTGTPPWLRIAIVRRRNLFWECRRDAEATPWPISSHIQT